MEKLMNNDLNVLLDNIIKVVKESKEYKNCLLLKAKMNDNEELLALIDEVKKKQKQYVKSSFQDDSLKKELENLEEELNRVPLYLEYNQNLEVVNQMINRVNEELNDYFNNKFNILK